ncbi:hypothetical protein ACVU02_000574 [Listeria monocytogenes]
MIEGMSKDEEHNFGFTSQGANLFEVLREAMDDELLIETKIPEVSDPRYDLFKQCQFTNQI